jgi:hypothetical protein
MGMGIRVYLVEIENIMTRAEVCADSRRVWPQEEHPKSLQALRGALHTKPDADSMIRQVDTASARTLHRMGGRAVRAEFG